MKYIELSTQAISRARAKLLDDKIAQLRAILAGLEPIRWDPEEELTQPDLVPWNPADET